MTYEELEEKGYDFKQINQMLKAEKQDLDFSKLSVHISADIMRQIIDLNPEGFDASRIKLLANCLRQGFDTSYVLDTEKYNYKQAAEIVDAMFKKVNYKMVANPAWTSKQMKSVKKALIAGIDEEIASLLKPSQFKKYLELSIQANKCGFDIKTAIKEGYDASQIPFLMTAHNTKTDIMPYVTPEFDAYQIIEITDMVRQNKRLNLGVDISEIAKKEFTPKTMRVLFQMAQKGSRVKELYTGQYNKNQINVVSVALKNNLDYKILLNPKLTAEQMNMILCGLQGKLDAKLYANPELTPSQMKLIFDNLKYNRDNPGKEIDVSLLIHPELSYQEIAKSAKILKTGSLDEKLEVMKKHNELINKGHTERVIDNEHDIASK